MIIIRRPALLAFLKDQRVKKPSLNQANLNIKLAHLLHLKPHISSYKTDSR